MLASGVPPSVGYLPQCTLERVWYLISADEVCTSMRSPTSMASP